MSFEHPYAKPSKRERLGTFQLTVVANPDEWAYAAGHSYDIHGFFDDFSADVQPIKDSSHAEPTHFRYAYTGALSFPVLRAVQQIKTYFPMEFAPFPQETLSKAQRKELQEELDILVATKRKALPFFSFADEPPQSMGYYSLTTYGSNDDWERASAAYPDVAQFANEKDTCGYSDEESWTLDGTLSLPFLQVVKELKEFMDVELETNIHEKNLSPEQREELQQVLTSLGADATPQQQMEATIQRNLKTIYQNLRDDGFTPKDIATALQNSSKKFVQQIQTNIR